MDNTNSLTWEWLLGFIEGEGCFTVSHTKDSERHYLIPKFELFVSSDDRMIVENIRKFLGIGKIYYKRPRQNLGYISKATVGLVVCKKKELIILRNLLKPLHWHTKKQYDFLLWSSCIDIIEQVRQTTYEGKMEIARYRDRLNGVKNKNERCNYYSAEKMQELLMKDEGK